jgi:tetraacyldisaccharide 4'-kinase
MTVTAPILDFPPEARPENRYLALVSGQARGFAADLARTGLLLVSVPYGWAMRARNGLFDRGWRRALRASVPVISVGNLTLGGTGKTPCVEYVARLFRDHRLRVAVLSRGYGSAGNRNDEALVLEENLQDVPHLQGSDRVALAATACEQLKSEILILDDGFQHRRLGRDLDVVLVDATNPWGHGRLFPRGLLRESPSGLCRAHVVALTRSDQASQEQRERLRQTIARLTPCSLIIETVHQPLDLQSSAGESLPLDALQDRPVFAYCGLGNPEAFRRTLLDLGADLRAFRTFPDHHVYTRTDVEALRTWARQQATEGLVVTTQKDLVKLRLTELGGRALYALRVRLHVTSGQDEFDHKLLSMVRRP